MKWRSYWFVSTIHHPRPPNSNEFRIFLTLSFSLSLARASFAIKCSDELRLRMGPLQLNPSPAHSIALMFRPSLKFFFIFRFYFASFGLDFSKLNFSRCSRSPREYLFALQLKSHRKKHVDRIEWGRKRSWFAAVYNECTLSTTSGVNKIEVKKLLEARTHMHGHTHTYTREIFYSVESNKNKTNSKISAFYW